MPAAIAIAGSMIAGITTVEAVLRPHWWNEWPHCQL